MDPLRALRLRTWIIQQPLSMGYVCVRRFGKSNRVESRPSNSYISCSDMLTETQLAFINATVVSSIRLQKPHSLSYQLQTLTSLPSITRVKPES